MKKKTILILAIALNAICCTAQNYNNIAGIYEKTGATTRNNVSTYNGGNVLQAANCLSVTDGTDSSSSSLTVYGTTHIQAGQSVKYIEKAAAYTVTAYDYYINCTTDTFNVQLPTAVGKKGQVYGITSSDAGSVTATTTSSQTINGASTKVITTKKTLWVISNGANWIIIGFS